VTRTYVDHFVFGKVPEREERFEFRIATKDVEKQASDASGNVARQYRPAANYSTPLLLAHLRRSYVRTAALASILDVFLVLACVFRRRNVVESSATETRLVSLSDEDKRPYPQAGEMNVFQTRRYEYS